MAVVETSSLKKIVAAGMLAAEERRRSGLFATGRGAGKLLAQDKGRGGLLLLALYERPQKFGGDVAQ